MAERELSLGEQPHNPEHCDRDGQPHLGPCVERTPTLRRAAVIFLGEEILARILSLPEGWTVTGVRDDFMRNGIMIRVTGPTAPECPPGTQPYHAQIDLEYVSPSPEDLAANPHAAGKLRVILPDWLLEGDDEPWKRER